MATGPPPPYPRLMVGSVVPIVIGYAIAHYVTLLVVEGQRTAINWSDPLGRGWNVFGSAEMGVNSALFNYPHRDRGDPVDSPSWGATCSASSSPTNWPSGTCRPPRLWWASCRCCW